MLLQHIALVPEAQDGIDPSEVARVGAALQKQVTRDLNPTWGVNATVDTFPRLEDVPAGYWPILVTRCELGTDGGVHLDRDGTPYAQIEHSPDWSIDASRACLEMLVNPFGKRTVSAASPRSDQGRVEVVIEICSPCGDTLNAYAINDVLVSDFCLPAFYEEGPVVEGKRLSLNGSVGSPFRVLPGGHMTWYDLVSESYWRRSHWGENPIDVPLGRLPSAASSARELGPRSVPALLRSSSPAHEALHARLELDRQQARQLSERKALRLRASLVTSDGPRRSALSERMLPQQPTRVLLMQEGREPEPVTVIDVTEAAAAPEAATPKRSTVPPPLPARASEPSAPPAERPALTSTAPVSILRDDAAPSGRIPVLVAAVALVAVVIAVAWSPGAPSAPSKSAAAPAPVLPPQPEPLAPPTAPPGITTAEAATAPAATPEPGLETKPEPAPSPQPAVKAQPRANASTQAKKLAPAAKVAAKVASEQPPAPVAPPSKITPPAAPVAPALQITAKAPAAPGAAPSIDALIDTRR